MTETRDLSLFVRCDPDGIARMDLAVEGVGCAGCIRKIENGLKELPGITECTAQLHQPAAWRSDGATRH